MSPTSGGIIREGDELRAVRGHRVRGLRIEELAKLILGLFSLPRIVRDGVRGCPGEKTDRTAALYMQTHT
jgi:hypothetical protein